MKRFEKVKSLVGRTSMYLTPSRQVTRLVTFFWKKFSASKKQYARKWQMHIDPSKTIFKCKLQFLLCSLPLKHFAVP